MCIDLCPSHATERPSVAAARVAVEAPYFAFNSPLLASKAVSSSWGLVVMCALIARGKFKPEREFQAGTSSYHVRIIYVREYRVCRGTRYLCIERSQKITFTIGLG